MFERFTEKARRAIFFARYEASQYGSPYIETEHLLLGVLREHLELRAILKDTGGDSEIRREIERHIIRRERISTSVEVPPSADFKKVLHFAAEEADRLSHRHVAAPHMLLGILRIEESLGARVAKGRGVNLEEIREAFANVPATLAVANKYRKTVHRKPASSVLEEFLTGLKSQSPDQLMSCFTKNAQVIDVHGKLWTHQEIARSFRDIFAPYAKKNASYVIEETPVDSNEQLIAIVLWKNALVASMERVWMHRMTVVLIPEDENWAIVSAQATPVHA